LESIKNGPTISNFAGFAYTKEKNKTDDPTKFKDLNKFDSFKKAVKLFLILTHEEKIQTKRE